ncbi:MAG TPA: crotonase/enoyl-CoA hydratase family protein [Nitriliruptoraceae bacterium]|nr:crotonase/enoyl-CoA hydratase family protein [Nitriliruptoraceae bacterium]
MTVRVAITDGIATITIDRPDVRNAVDGPTALALERAVDAAGKADEVQAIVLTGSAGTFCAGADLHAIARDPGRRNRLEAQLRGPMGPTRMRAPVPVVAAIEGHAVAGGLELALWADLRVMAADAVVGVFCRRWGVPLIDGGTVRLPRLIGMSRALDLVLTGRAVGADEAQAMGLVNRVCPPGRAATVATELAGEIIAFPAPAMLADRAGVHAAFDLDLDAALLAEHERGMQAIRADGMADVARFVEGAGRGGTFD